jgi:FixJ family two-component response regulator
MHTQAVLIVDDEKNIRLTLAAALEPLQVPVETAVNGEEALQKVAEKPFAVMLLDLKLPGMDGIEVLRRVGEAHPEISVIIITAYGSVEVAVEAMKLGAVDFLQKPFHPSDVRDMVGRLFKEGREEKLGQRYETYVSLAKERINAGEFDAARIYAHKAVFINPNRPEAFNILGGLWEAKANRREADKNYRVALDLDPSYAPARQNLERVTTRPYTQLGIVWDYPPKKKTP